MIDFRPLLAWYGRGSRPLPWRVNPTPYRVLVSEFMLQQTRADVVIPYYERFLARFPDIETLARADVEDVLPLWSGLGYYRRARNLHESARRVVALGAFPDTEESLQALPGVGAYTAAAIASIAFARPAVALDGNAVRVLSRLLGYEGSSHSHLRAATLPSVPEARAADLTQSLMELGATLCRPRAPLCDSCPLAAACRARIESKTDSIPARAKARPTVDVTLEALVCRQGERMLLTRERDAPLLAGMWTVPYRAEGGLADLAQQLGVPLSEVQPRGEVRHGITFRRITVRVYAAEAASLREGVEERTWVDHAGLAALAIPSLTRKILERANSRGPG